MALSRSPNLTGFYLPTSLSLRSGQIETSYSSKNSMITLKMDIDQHSKIQFIKIPLVPVQFLSINFSAKLIFSRNIIVKFRLLKEPEL